MIVEGEHSYTVIMRPGEIYTLFEDSSCYKKSLNFVGTYAKDANDLRTWKVKANPHQTIRTFFPPSKKLFDASCIEATHPGSFFNLIYCGDDIFAISVMSTGLQLHIK